VLGFIAEVRDRDHRRRRLEQTFPEGIRSPRFDKLLRVPLYGFQREGALFAARAGRCLIGDEMGLGKTIQAIAAVEIMAELFGVETRPCGLPHFLEASVAARNRKIRGPVCRSYWRGTRPAGANCSRPALSIRSTNYDTLHRDLDLIAAWAPDAVVNWNKEAQRIKNWNTRAARSVKTALLRLTQSFSLGHRWRIAWRSWFRSIEFVDRHRLGPAFRFLAQHQNHDPETGRVVGYKNLDSIWENVWRPILIRRKTDEVLRETARAAGQVPVRTNDRRSR